jgi:hypothetical protein
MRGNKCWEKLPLAHSRRFSGGLVAVTQQNDDQGAPNYYFKHRGRFRMVFRKFGANGPICGCFSSRPCVFVRPYFGCSQSNPRGSPLV